VLGVCGKKLSNEPPLEFLLVPGHCGSLAVDTALLMAVAALDSPRNGGTFSSTGFIMSLEAKDIKTIHI